MSTTQNLQNIGISSEEYATYKVILQTPPVNISELAKEVGVTRATLYNILERLEEKKLITRVKNPKTKVKYQAAPPETLLSFAKDYKEETEKQLDSLKRQIPILQALAGDNANLDASDVMVFRGPHAMDELDNLVFQSKEQLYGFTYEYHVDACFKIDARGRVLDNEYLRVVMNCGDKFVFPGTKEGIQKAKQLLVKNPILAGKWEPRWIDPKKFQMKINCYIFEENTAFSYGSFKQSDFLAYMIRNREIAESMKCFSQFLWENANKV